IPPKKKTASGGSRNKGKMTINPRSLRRRAQIAAVEGPEDQKITPDQDDAEIPGREELGDPVERARMEQMLATEGMSEVDRQFFSQGHLHLEASDHRWRHLRLKAMWFCRARISTVDAVSRRPGAQEEMTQEGCVHPPWARYSSSNQHCYWTDCLQRKGRPARRQKTDEEKADAQRKKARMQAELEQMIKDHDLQGEGPWTAPPRPKAPPLKLGTPEHHQGYAPRKPPPPGAPLPKRANPPPRMRAATVAEMQQALFDMNQLVESQHRSSERCFQRIMDMATQQDRQLKEATGHPKVAADDGLGEMKKFAEQQSELITQLMSRPQMSETDMARLVHVATSLTQPGAAPSPEVSEAAGSPGQADRSGS
ncbi:unnamed protein product, partial [Prorocentrum cordatum]